MHRFLCSLFVICLACAVQAAPYRLAIFGDSLSAGHNLPPEDAMYSQLEKALNDKGYEVRIIHASKSGETTTGGLSRQGSLLVQNPDGVLLELGINDFFRHHDLSTTEQNLDSLITRFLDKKIPVLLIGMKVPPNAPNQAEFEQMYRSLADRYHLVFYPFYMDGIFHGEFLPGKPNPYLLSDNLHPNAEGVAIMVRGILPTVEKFLNAQGVFAY